MIESKYFGVVSHIKYTRALVLFLILIQFFPASCSKRSGKIVDVNVKNATVKHITASVLLDSICPSPSRLLCLNDYVIILNNTPSGDCLYVYSLIDGSVHSSIRKGRGPGEMISIFDLDFIENGERLALLDFSAQHIQIIPSSALIRGDIKPSDFQSVDVSSGPLVIQITGQPQGVYTTVLNSDYRLMEIKTDGRRIPLGSYSPNIYKRKKDMFLNQAYMGRLVYNSHRNQIAIGCRYADQLEIFSIDNEDVVFIKGPEDFEPKYTVVKTVDGEALNHDSDEKLGYTHIRADEEYIYALYSGKTNSESRATYGKIIRIFDWNGTLHRVLELDKEISSFDISGDGKNIFAVDGDNVFIYQLWS